MKIIIDLSPESLDSAAKVLADYEKHIKPKLEEVCKRLAELAAQEAESHLVLYMGNTDAKIDPITRIDNGYKISMSGTDVYFVEFGTGDQVAPHFDTQVPVAWGSWSAEHAQKLWNYGFWWYGGEQLTGTEAYMPMFYAEKKIREAIPQVVKEVFGE